MPVFLATSLRSLRSISNPALAPWSPSTGPSFYAALERFLRYGPVGAKKCNIDEEDEPAEYRRNMEEFEGRGMLIDTLVLGFQSAELELAFPPEGVTYEHWRSRHWGGDRRGQSETSQTSSSDTMHPEWLCQYLRDWIGGHPHMSYHTSEYRQPLYEHIGAIRMLVDGQLYCEYDIAALASSPTVYRSR